MNSYRILTGLTAALLSLPLFAAAPTQNADLVKAATQQLDSAREAAFRGDLAAQMDIYRAADASRNDAREESERLRETFATNEKALADASEALRLRTGSLGEMFGIVRQTATDLQSVTDNSIVRIDHPDIAANLALAGMAAGADGLLLQASSQSTLPHALSLPALAMLQETLRGIAPHFGRKL